MKTKIFLLAAMLTICSLSGKAQWVVTDPTNLVQGIVNTANQVIQTSSTAANMLKNFQEVQKVYSQGKQYYDALKSVHDLVKDARKVQQTILLVGDISDIYVNSFQKMIADENFSVKELNAIALGYAKLLEESSAVLTELKTVTSANGLSMSDAERMSVVNRIYNEVREYKNLVQYYTNKNISVSYLRAKKKNDTDRIMALYGSPSERYW
jgi:altronate dehydratase